MVKANRTNKGFTIIEMLLVLLPLAILFGVSGTLFVVSLSAWNSGYIRTEVREDIIYAMEKTVKDLKAMATDSLCQYDYGNGVISHAIQYDDLDGNTYVLYLYNVNDDTLDSVYSQSFYDLRKADIDHGDTPAAGDGVLILRDLTSPDAGAPATSLTVSGTKVNLDVVVQRNDEMVRIRTCVRPRNL